MVDEVRALSAFRDPSKPIPAEASKLHRISNEMVKGASIDVERVRSLVEPAQLIIAHTASFDRPMVEKHWPIFEDKNWARLFADIDWKGEGVGSAKLHYLLYAQGWFHDGHRAFSDALATLFLLTQTLPETRRLAFAALLANARKPVRAVRAEDTLLNSARL